MSMRTGGDRSDGPERRDAEAAVNAAEAAEGASRKAQPFGTGRPVHASRFPPNAAPGADASVSRAEALEARGGYRAAAAASPGVSARLAERSAARSRSRGTSSRSADHPTEERSGKTKRGTRHFRLISDLLKAGQEIIVQIAKEPLGPKGRAHHFAHRPARPLSSSTCRASTTSAFAQNRER